MLFVVAELGGYLLPQVLELRLVGGQPSISTRIMVYVEDAILTSVDDVIDHLFDTCHPSFVHLAVAVHVVAPGHRYTDRIEACVLEHREQFCLGLGLSPAGLRVEGVLSGIIDGIKGVT